MLAVNLPDDLLYISHSADETRRLGRIIGTYAVAGDLLTLRGDLGAGKTTLIQGVAEGMEVTEPVVSPSFTLIHKHPGRVNLYHLDLYRLARAELPEIGLDDVLGTEAVVAVEWSERLPPELSGDALEIELMYGDAAEDRLITLRATGPHGQQLFAAVREELHAGAGD